MFNNQKLFCVFKEKNWEIYVTIHQEAKFYLSETLLFTFQIQWILGKINDLSFIVIVMLRPFQKCPPAL